MEINIGADTMGEHSGKEWVGAFWDSLIYPGYSSDTTFDPKWAVSYVYENVMDAQFPDFVACMGLEEYSPSSPNNAEVLKKTMERICGLLPEKERYLLGFAHHNNLYFCGFCEREKFARRLEELQENLLRYDGILVTIGLAFLPNESFKGWEWAAQRAVVAERQKIREGIGRVYVYSGDRSKHLPISTYQGLIDTLWHLVLNGRLSEVDSYLHEANQELFEGTYIPILNLRPLIQMKISVMGWAAIEAGVDPDQVLPKIQGYLSEISVLYDYVKVREVLFRAVTDFTSSVYDHYACESSYLIKRAEDFIDTHISEELSLSGISHALGVHPSYLSRRFKAEKGINLTQYINRKRIQRAKQLLLDKRLTITEVASSVGFNTIQNFGRVFKMLEGCSPSDYRDGAIRRSTEKASKVVPL